MKILPVHTIPNKRSFTYHRVAFRSLGWLREPAVGEGQRPEPCVLVCRAHSRHLDLLVGRALGELEKESCRAASWVWCCDLHSRLRSF